jgi:hypothetical protein
MGKSWRPFSRGDARLENVQARPATSIASNAVNPKPPAEGVVIVQAISDKVSNISAVCPTCGGTMYGRASNHRLKEFEANLGGAIPKAVPRIGETTDPSLNCDFDEEHQP